MGEFLNEKRIFTYVWKRARLRVEVLGIGIPRKESNFLLSQTVQTASVEPTQTPILGYRDAE